MIYPANSQIREMAVIQMIIFLKVSMGMRLTICMPMYDPMPTKGIATALSFRVSVLMTSMCV